MNVPNWLSKIDVILGDSFRIDDSVGVKLRINILADNYSFGSQ